MTNKERYLQAFSALYASADFSMEVETMQQTAKQHRIRKAAALMSLCLILFGSATAAYAADVGGIQRSVQVFFCGDQTDATIHCDHTAAVSYDVHHYGHHTSGSTGPAAEVTDADLVPETAVPDVTYADVTYESDGSVWVCWNGQRTNITDKFDDGLCYITLLDGAETAYMTIEYGGCHTISTHRYTHCKHH